jgi:fibronectin type 3 domain-containing protein
MHPRRSFLRVESLEDRLVPSFFPPTTNGIHIFEDQLPGGLSNAMLQFLAAHTDGTQKILLNETNQLRALNANYSVLHYQLGTGNSAFDYIINNQWASDFSTVTQHEDWFAHQTYAGEPQSASDLASGRVGNSTGWYQADIANTAWQQYTINQVLQNIAATGGNGWFADSFTYGIGGAGYDGTIPTRYQGTNAATTSAWPGGVDWTTQLGNWAQAIENGFAQYNTAHGTSYKFIPNLDARVTSWEPNWYDNASGVPFIDGGFLEGFGQWTDTYDWTLSMNRGLNLSDNGKIVIMQPYPADDPSTAAGQQEVNFYLGTYLLLKGDESYLNIMYGTGAQYFPQYQINLGAPTTALPSNVSSYLWNGVYRRDFQNGFVLVNPGTTTNTLNLGGTFREAQGTGGGTLTDAQLDANGNYIDGTLSYQNVSSVTLTGGSAAIFLNVAQPPAAPTGLTATAASTSQINLSWSSSSGATSYKIQRSTDGTNFSPLATVGTTTYSDTGLNAGTLYYYRVLASNAAGDSAPSGVVSAVTAGASQLAISGPTQATAGTGFSVTVTAQGTTGNTATGYTGKIHFTNTGQGVLPADYTFVAADHGVHTFTVTLQTAGTQSVTVTDAGNAALTATAGGIVVSPAAASLSLSSVAAAPASVGVGGTLTVTLTAVDPYGNAEPSGLTVQFQLGTGSANGSFGAVAYAGGGKYTAVFTASAAGGNTINATINGQAVTASPASITVTSAPVPPAAPTALTATAASTSQINLSWTASSGATSYKIQRSTDGATFTPLATVGAVTTYSDSGLNAGTQYYYRVLASNAAGDSAPSGVASAVTTGASKLAVSGPTQATAGTGFSVTVTAQGTTGNTATGYTGKVHFTNTGQGVLPADYTFVAADHGVHTFTVTLQTAGTQSVTATDAGNSALTATAGGIVVGPATASLSLSSVSASPTNTGIVGTLTVTLTAVDAYGNAEPSGLTVQFRLGTGSANGSFGAITYAGAGKYTTVFTASAAGSNTINATINGQAVTASPASITVNSTPVVHYLVRASAGSGTWRYTTTSGWQLLTPSVATQVVVDSAGDVAAEFPGYGLWLYTAAAGWKQINGVDVTQLAISHGGTVVAEFPGYGVGEYAAGTGWHTLTGANASLLAVNDQGTVVAEFPGYGIYQFLTISGWKLLNGVDVTALALNAQGDVVANFAGYGVAEYVPASGWRMLNGTQATSVAVDDLGNVAAEFQGIGVGEYVPAGGWSLLTAANATQLVANAVGDFFASFAGYGVWEYDPTRGWIQLTSSDASLIAAS